MSKGFKRVFALILGIVLTFVQSCTSRTRDCEVLDTLESQLQDWPALSHYREANAQLPPPAQNEARIVFFGDSITAWWNDPQDGGFFPGKPYVNRGISSQTTPQMLIRFQPDVIALKPRVVVILAGTNDIGGVTGPTSLRAIEDNLTSMAILARAHNIHVVVSSVLPTHDNGRDEAGKPIMHSRNRPPEQIRALNEWMKEFAARQEYFYLDYYFAMIDDRGALKQELSDDGVHPNRKGYAVMAPLVEQAIAAAMKQQA